MGTEPEPISQEDLSRGILPTDIHPSLAWLLIGLFLVVIFTVPVVQVATELMQHRPLQALTVFTRRPTQENLHQYEKNLEKQSAARHLVQPRLQQLLSRHLGFGNASVLVGRDRWLFYRPGVEFLTGPGLLDPARLQLRKKELVEEGQRNPCPDPRSAILAFHQACQQAGVHLVLVPIPDKAMLQPEHLTVRLIEPEGVPTNVDYPAFLAGLRSAGVDVFDPTPAQLLPGEEPRFLEQDTHWTPRWMEEVAARLALHLRTQVPGLHSSPHLLQAVETRVRRVGDLVDMLQLPPRQKAFPPQVIAIRRVLDPETGAAWQPRADAEVLLLGDSFSNIYTAAAMGWGDAAGFPAHLALHLGRDVDVLARNGSAATTIRRELARRPAPLAGKRVVVWEFAVRELMLGNWEAVPLPSPALHSPASPRSHSTTPEEPLVIEGVVQAVSRLPRPHSTPYKDCLAYVRLRVARVVQGSYADEHLIAALWVMKDNELLPAAHYAPGQHVRLRVVPFRQEMLDLRTVCCVDDLDDYQHRPYLVLEE